MRLLLLTVSMMLGFCGSVLADNYYADPVIATGLSETERQSVNELIEIAFSDMDSVELVEERSQANFILSTRVVKLGQGENDRSLIVSMKTKSLRGKKQFGTRLKAKNFGDLDRVVIRLVRSVVSKDRKRKKAKVGEVTEEEQESNLRRIKATNQYTFGFGPAWLSGLNENDSTVLFETGYVWGIDEHYELNLLGHLTLGKGDSKASYVDVVIGVNYFFNANRTAPYIRGALGYGGATADDQTDGSLVLSDDDASGFVMNLGLGVKLFRTSTVSLGLSYDYSVIMSKTEKSEKNPSVNSLRLSVFF